MCVCNEISACVCVYCILIIFGYVFGRMPLPLDQVHCLMPFMYHVEELIDTFRNVLIQIYANLLKNDFPPNIVPSR